ncbi:hypothetical protein LRD18_00070 [Halorhodospira halochloris]|uniref:hypothetical protein n=1 Tax=Halorhodospira halochloris TaxID=1052 RepID=UPI001EE9AA80|nr:hypothetical protein [Halorhodospira halochloris]MCG5529266.1 hypothetical protein [Halorhodospira halochloris]MCG5547240.1 hypothetical protein [Halorhodospira halochloris]
MLTVALAVLATLITLAPAKAEDEQLGYGLVIDDSWRLNFGYGTMKVLDGSSSGRANSISLANGARVVADSGATWDFEAGLSYAKTDDHPLTPAGETIRIGQAELFSQARRLFGSSGWFMGWHIGVTRLTLRPDGDDNERDMDTSLGVIAGWISPWGISLQLDAITTSPSPDISIPEHLRVEYETLQYRGTIGIRF